MTLLKPSLAANQNSPVIAVTTFTVDMIEEVGSGTIFACELNSSQSSPTLYNEAHNADIWRDIISPYYRQLLGNVQIISRRHLTPGNTNHFDGQVIFGNHLTAATFSGNAQDLVPRTFFEPHERILVADIPLQLSAIYRRKDIMHALMRDGIFPHTQLTAQGRTIPDAVLSAFKAAKLVVKQPKGSDGLNIRVIAKKQPPYLNFPKAQRDEFMVVQKFIECKPITVPQRSGNYRSWVRGYVSCIVRADGTFEQEIHGLARDVADDPVTKKTIAAQIANIDTQYDSINPKPLSHFKLTDAEQRPFIDFLNQRIAPEMQRLMTTPFSVLVNDARAQAIAQDDNGRLACLDALFQSKDYEVGNAALSNLSAPDRPTKNDPRTFIPNDHIWSYNWR